MDLHNKYTKKCEEKYKDLNPSERDIAILNCVDNKKTAFKVRTGILIFVVIIIMALIYNKRQKTKIKN